MGDGRSREPSAALHAIACACVAVAAFAGFYHIRPPSVQYDYPVNEYVLALVFASTLALLKEGGDMIDLWGPLFCPCRSSPHDLAADAIGIVCAAGLLAPFAATRNKPVRDDDPPASDAPVAPPPSMTEL